MTEARLAHRVVVVTGAAMGIGRATALAAGREGASVAVCDLADAPAERVAGEIRAAGGAARAYHLDVAKEADVRAAFDLIRAELGPIFGLVNNAGISGVNKPTHAIEEAEWDRVIAVNVKGVFLCTKHAVPDMIQQHAGSIVNLSSIYGLVSSPDVPPYHASKGAVRLMSKTDALLYAKDGVRVNSVHPGFIDTPMLQNYVATIGERKAVYDQLGGLHPMGRVGTADEVANGIVFLLSNDASFMTGSELVIDGGYTCR